MKLIIDTNLWISFLIGKRLAVLSSLLTNSHLSFFVCDELLKEIEITSSKQKIRKYIGDKDLLELRFHNHTKIVTYNEFKAFVVK